MKANRLGFRITDAKGFHVTFENGYTVSVQFGYGNYADNYDMEGEFPDKNQRAGERGSSTAECAVWKGGNSLIDYPAFDGDTVGNRMTPAQVLELMNWAASQASEAGVKHG